MCKNYYVTIYAIVMLKLSFYGRKVKLKRFGTNLFLESKTGYAASMKSASKAGFKFVDFDLTEHNDPPYDQEEKFFSEVKRVADGEGVTLNQAHAPYMKGIRSDYDYFLGKDFERRVRDSIRRAGYLGIPYLVEHPFECYPKGYESEKMPLPEHKVMDKEVFDRNVEFFSKFKDDLKRYNVKMAIENCYLHDFVGRKHAPAICSRSVEMNALIDQLGDDHYCVCFDNGHLNLIDCEKISDYVKNVGKRIKVLHLHDNFGIQNDWFGELDRHLLPFLGSFDWQNFKTALDGIGFDGVYSFESSVYGPVQLIDDYYRLMFKSAQIIFD